MKTKLITKGGAATLFAIIDATMKFPRKFILSASIIIISSLSPCNADDPPHDQNPPEIVGRALGCFNHVYTCPSQYRLTITGLLNVPYEATEEYCNGECFEGTQVVLTCIDQILSNFLFYNKATIDDIRETIVQGCSNTDKRGDFDVMERIQANSKATNIRPKYSGATVMIFVTMVGLLISL